MLNKGRYQKLRWTTVSVIAKSKNWGGEHKLGSSNLPGDGEIEGRFLSMLPKATKRLWHTFRWLRFV